MKNNNKILTKTPYLTEIRLQKSPRIPSNSGPFKPFAAGPRDMIAICRKVNARRFWLVVKTCILAAGFQLPNFRISCQSFAECRSNAFSSCRSASFPNSISHYKGVDQRAAGHEAALYTGVETVAIQWLHARPKRSSPQARFFRFREAIARAIWIVSAVKLEEFIPPAK
ncbi:hypothetical protein [Rhizobium laguerreae]|uniref:hypothetical protein n=1 Tax=Rhizobium laguerreae TaxID=1076926 RepID=UPI001441791E|nr:hypothetical protein [Rhizobium laguerreae]NKN15513.1 hypothetical protein [Rhizobium laguerreae]